MRCKLSKLNVTQNILGSNYLLMINIHFHQRTCSYLKMLKVIGFPSLRYNIGDFKLGVTMQLLHKRKQSTWNCYIWKSAMAKVLLATLVATSGNNDIHVNIFQVTAYYSTHVHMFSLKSQCYLCLI